MNVLWWIALGSFVVMTLGWWWQQRHRDAGIVDALWAWCLGISALVVAVIGQGDPWHRCLVGIAGGIWGIRLGTHLLRDRIIGKPEDGRYQAMRQWMGHRASWGFLLFFQAQTLAVVMCALPLVIVANLPWVSSWWFIAATSLIGISLVGCAIADAQLAQFRADPSSRGQVCNVGLWRYSRHPNYFFEWIQWWGWGLLCATHPAWWGWLGTAMIAVMYLLLTRVTGIPHVERRALAHRGEAYARYQRTTNAFFPWRVRKDPAP